MVADDLDGVLVRADRAVRAEAVELARGGACGSRVELLGEVERGVRHILVDTDGEVVLGLVLFEVLVDGEHHRGVELLGAKAVSAADDGDVLHAVLEERGADVKIEGLAEGAGLLGAVEDSHLLAACGDGLHEGFGDEGAIQADLDETVLLARCVELVDGLFHRLCARTHDDDDFFCIGSADVVEEVVAPARERGNFVHHLLHDGGSGEVVAVRGLAVTSSIISCTMAGAAR